MKYKLLLLTTVTLSGIALETNCMLELSKTERVFKAVKSDDVDTIVKLINEEDVSVNICQVGESLLHIAAGRGHLRATQLLISLKADVNAQNGSGLTPL